MAFHSHLQLKISALKRRVPRKLEPTMRQARLTFLRGLLERLSQQSSGQIRILNRFGVQSLPLGFNRNQIPTNPSTPSPSAPLRLKTNTRPTHKTSFQCRALIVAPQLITTQSVQLAVLLRRLCMSPATATSKQSLAGLLAGSCRVCVLLCD